MISPTEKVALITGAGKRRVGNCIARRLARRGYAIAVHYLSSADEARQTVAELEQQGTRAAAFPADVADPAQVDRLFDQTTDQFGRLDVLVASSDYPDTYSLLWQQQAGGTFAEVGEAAGARVDRAHGLGLVDYDRDGDYDLVVGTSLMRWDGNDSPPAPDDTYIHVLRNDSGEDVNKLILDVRGSGEPGGANRDAVGARVTVSAGGRTYVREIHGAPRRQYETSRRASPRGSARAPPNNRP